LGTYQQELADEPCVYGVRKPLQSWNPFFANMHVHWQLIKDCWHARRWRDKLRIWFMPTGWRPADVEDAYPLVRCLPATQQKFNAAPSAPLSLSVLMIHICLMGFTVWFLINMSVAEFGLALAHFIPLGGGLWVNSRILELRPHAILHSSLFWVCCALLPWWVDGWMLPAQISSLVFVFIAVLMPLAAGRRLHSQTV
jgi:hypothetical protein